MPGRALTVGEASLTPWCVELTVGDLAIAGLPEGAAPLPRAGRIHIDVSRASLLKRAPVIAVLEIDPPGFDHFSPRWARHNLASMRNV